MMVVPVRWIIIGMKRPAILFILLLISISLFSIMLHEWSNVPSSVNGYSNDIRVHLTSATLKKQDESRKHVKYILDNLGNRTEIRLKRLRQKVERISRKVKSQAVTLVENKYLNNEPNYRIHVFYYSWYGNVAFEGQWRHWNHQYLPNWKKEDRKVYPTGTHTPPSDISSNFYPALGCYSSADPAVIHIHMKEIYEANIGVIVVSWYPPGISDPAGKSPDPVLPILLDIAQEYNLKVALHIEPYRNRNPTNFSQHLLYIMTRYGSHPALFRILHKEKKLPVFYMYDSYLTPSGSWKELFSTKGNLSVRGTHLDGVFLGLLVEMQHKYDIKKAHFDGFYTYFATNGFTYGSSWKNWRSLSKFAHQNDLLFVPSVGPGYIDMQVRPWNGVNTRHRRHGKYYEVAWRSAIAAQAQFVAITSFNEWHEGTQIEPAIPHSTSTFTYLDYEPEGSYFYMNLTKWWINEFTSVKS